MHKAYANELQKDEVAGEYKFHILWDILPSYYINHPELFDRNGYVKDGMAYRVSENNDKTIAFYCHYGLTSLLLSYLWNVSPFVVWQFTALAMKNHHFQRDFAKDMKMRMNATRAYGTFACQ